MELAMVLLLLNCLTCAAILCVDMEQTVTEQRQGLLAQIKLRMQVIILLMLIKMMATNKPEAEVS